MLSIQLVITSLNWLLLVPNKYTNLWNCNCCHVKARETTTTNELDCGSVQFSFSFFQFNELDLQTLDIPHHNPLCTEILYHTHLAEDKVWEKLKVQVITTVNPCISCKIPLSIFHARFCLLLMPGHPSLVIPICQSLGTTLMLPLTSPTTGSLKPNNWHLKELKDNTLVKTSHQSSCVQLTDISCMARWEHAY